MNNALSPHNQCGFYGPRHVLHFAPFKQCALIIITWVLPKFVLIYGFLMPCMYCILGFCSMMNVYRIINYLGARVCPTSFNHGKGSKVPFHSCPKPHQVPFLNKDLVWRFGIRHGGQNKVTIQFAYVPYARILEFLEGELGDTSTPMEWNVYKNFPSQINVKQPTIKNNLGHTW
jgi:hypothetical protein